MSVKVTDAERQFMSSKKHENESWVDSVIRESGTVTEKVGQTDKGDPVYQTSVKDSKYAMDAVVPKRRTEEQQQAFDAMTDEQKANEIRNAQAQANILNDHPSLRR
jgi:hypothetical protein